MAVSDVVDALAAADPARKRALVKHLGELGDPAAIPALSALVRDRAESIAVRRAAADALGQIGDSRGCMALLAVLSEPGQPDRALIPRLEKVRAQLAAQLEQEADKTSLQRLLAEADSTIAHDGDRVRLLKISAVRALGGIGYALALKPLEDIIKAGQDAELVTAAEEALELVREQSGLNRPEPAPQSEPVFVYAERLVCSRCDITSETGMVQRCQNCRLSVCEAHAVRDAGLTFCSQSCLDSFAAKPGNWVYWT